MNFVPPIAAGSSGSRANKRGWWSPWLFLILPVLSLGAELIANDKAGRALRRRWYFPRLLPGNRVWRRIPAEANHKSPYIQELLKASMPTLGAGPVQLPEHQLRPQKYRRRPRPSSVSPVGTDDQGRDVLARVIYWPRKRCCLPLDAFTPRCSALSDHRRDRWPAVGFYVARLGRSGWQPWRSGPPLVFYLVGSSVSFVQPNFWWLLASCCCSRG
jgi:microcin C transport system permease protein